MVSVAIQAHPRRADHAEALAAAAAAEIVYDPEPNSRFPSPWRTYRAALECTPADATHRLIIQDDVELCDGFSAAAAAAVASRPDSVLVLFHGGQPRVNVPALNRALATGNPWAVLDRAQWVPVVALVWPVRLIEPFLAFVDAQAWPPAFRADDEIVGRGLRALGEQPLACVPSLVQHPDVTPSLVGRRARGGADLGRVAAHYTGRPPSAWAN